MGVLWIYNILPHNVTYLAPTWPDAFAKFKSDKTFHSAHDNYSTGCKNKNIDTLIAENRAIYFHPTNKPSITGSLLPNLPDVIRCGYGKVLYLTAKRIDK